MKILSKIINKLDEYHPVIFPTLFVISAILAGVAIGIIIVETFKN